MRQISLKKRVLTKLKYWVIFLLCWFVVHTGYTIWDGLTDKGYSADVGIILGNKVNDDGSLSSRLQARLVQGLQLYQQGRVKYLIVSGGLGKEGHWEAEKMREFLRDYNVPENAIIVDNFGNDTEATVENSLKIMQEKGFHSAISISQFFHQTRIKMLFRKNGFYHIESVSPLFFTLGDGYSLIREFVGFYVEWLK